MKQMHEQVVCSRREVEKLKEHVEKLIEEHGTTVEDDLDDHLTEIMTAKSKDVESMYGWNIWEGVLGCPESTLSVKKLSAMWWDPVIIHWITLSMIFLSLYQMYISQGTAHPSQALPL